MNIYNVIDKIKRKYKMYIMITLLTLLISGTYAWLTITINGNKNNIIRAGVLDLVLDDTDTDGIKMSDTVPMSDKKGLTQKAYTFKLINQGNTASDYSIYLDDLDLEQNEIRMKDNYVKYSLSKNENDDEIFLLSGSGSNPNRIIEEGTIQGKTTNTYTLRLWIDSSVGNDVMGTIFYGKLRVEAESTKNKEVVYNDVNIDLAKSPTVLMSLSSNISEDEISSYSIDDLDIATISDDGEITGLSPGTATLEVLNDNKEILQSTTINVQKTLTARYVMTGEGVNSIGATSNSCVLNTENPDECVVKTPTISTSVTYEPIGWSMSATDLSTTIDPQEETTIEDNVEMYSVAEEKGFTEGKYQIRYYTSGKSFKRKYLDTVKDGTNLLSATSLKIKKNGMTFKGWDTSSDATNVVFTDGADISNILKGDTTTIIKLYAVWVDDTAPICTWSSSSEVVFSNKKNFTITCKDYGSKVINQQVSTDNFKIDDGSVGQIVSVKSATQKNMLSVVKFYVYIYGSKVGNINVSNNLIISDGAGNITSIAPRNISVIGKTLTASFIDIGTGISVENKKVKCTTTESNDMCDINMPSIKETEGYEAVGWSKTRNETTGYNIGSKYTLSKNESFYSVSYFEEATYTANVDENGAVLSSKDTLSCTVPKQYNHVSLTSCNVNLPYISRNKYTIVGFSTNKDATTRSKLSGAKLSLNLSNTGKTWYPITYTTKIVYFESNGARLSSSSKTCKIYNKNTDCAITSPTITRSGYNIIGYSKNANDQTAEWGSTTKKIIDVSQEDYPTYYAITNKDVSINWVANNSEIDFTNSACKIINKDSSCKVNSPTITANSNTPIVVGFNKLSTGTISEIEHNSTVKVSSDATYYAITKSQEKNYSANFVSNGLTLSSTKSSCTIPSSYNGKIQEESCTVSAPLIQTIEGFLLGFSQDKDLSEITLNSGAELTLTSSNNEQTWYGIKSEIVPNDSILGYIESNKLLHDSTIGFVNYDSSYAFHTYNYDGDQVWTGNMTFGTASDVGSSSSNSLNTIVVKINGNLTINSGVTITTYSNSYGGPCGLILYVTGEIINNGTITMTQKGAKAPGQNVHLWKNKDGTYEYIPATGGSGGPSAYLYSSSKSKTTIYANGTVGSNAPYRGTGGGGSGGSSLARANYTYISTTSGQGSAGTSYSGGTGGGGIDMNYSGNQSAQSGTGNGGAGGVAYARRGNSGWTSRYAGGGAGNPGGSGNKNNTFTSSYDGKNGTGGLLVVYGNSITNNGTLSSNGVSGGSGTATGGSSGGGSINVFYRNSYQTTGSIQVNGGISYTGSANGGNGGSGSYTACSIKSESCVK